MSIDKKAIVDRLLRGYATPICTCRRLNTPPSTPRSWFLTTRKAKELLKASGFGPDNPVKFKISHARPQAQGL